MSKKHCYIKFQDNTWILQDGNEKRASSNGTWVYISEELDVYDGMIFKANELLI
jgi:hypothetical protein